MPLSILFDLKPYWFHQRPFTIGFYSVFFAATAVLGSAAWIWQARRGGYPRSVVFGWLLFGAVVCVLGARLGHCFFYEPGHFLQHPELILKVWRKGLSSHGLTVAIFAMLVILSRIKGYPTLDILDRFMFVVAPIVVLIRTGNFFNHEIVGRVTDVPWAVRFMYYDHARTARHPVQLYEAGLGLLVLGALLWFDAKYGRERRPRGLLTGVAVTLYFGGRFVLEFFKEFQSFSSGSILTEGQVLSLPWIAAGGAVLIWTLRRMKAAAL